MQINTRKVGSGLVIVSFENKTLDASNSKEFKDSMTPVLAMADKFVFDLSCLTFIDSSGLGAILSCLRTVSTRKAQIKICNLGKSVRIVFELVNMHKVFDVFNSVEEAQKSYE